MGMFTSFDINTSPMLYFGFIEPVATANIL